jgi:DNA-binding GntR family transcriptional regulator
MGRVMSAIPQVSRSSGLVGEVFQRIRADIISLKIPPGARVTMNSLVSSLGVSQTPIREALLLLEAAGLVSRRQSGYCVTQRLSRKALDQLFQVRLLLEPHAARRAAEKVGTDMQVWPDGLSQRSKLSQAAPYASVEEFSDKDAEFHQRIAQAGDNTLITQALAQLRTHLQIFRLSFSRKCADESAIEHQRISDAITSGDGNAAEAAMRAHIENSFARLAQHVGS